MNSIKNISTTLPLLSILVISGCAGIFVKDFNALYGPESPHHDRILTQAQVKSNSYVSFNKQVKPIFVQRCAVCHSCYDAPCQLNMSSIEGINRGATDRPVYDGYRFVAESPTRLGVDAQTTEQWREKGFYPVLNERRQNPQVNLDNSLLYQMLTLKRRNDYPTEGRLPPEYNVGTKLRIDESFVHEQVCPTIETFDHFQKEHPQWGMPFALPGLSEKEFDIVETWLEQGAKVEPERPLSEKVQARIYIWEMFLNGTSDKQRLMSRYLFEHLFLAHLYFEDIDEKLFFSLVRSRTPPGEPIDTIATNRPYDNPGTDTFYYRISQHRQTIVEKTHLPYALSTERMEWLADLFITSEYDVDGLPVYETHLAANPFKTFAAIPPKIRYRFLLEDASFYVGGFVKGPVCHGSIALSVVDDHFWIVFTDPEKDLVGTNPDFLLEASDQLRIPAEQGNNISMFATWTTYKGLVEKYLDIKVSYIGKLLEGDKGYSIDDIWDGNKRNTNAALTIHRHYDSASVLQGFVGELPKTAWVLDYPLLERIHYLLVAGFDVYGTLAHQVSTRLYMDFIRLEAEGKFLNFLPAKNRLPIYKHWYRGSNQVKDYLAFFTRHKHNLREPDINYQTDDVKTEFFLKADRHLKDAQQNVNYINQCNQFRDKCEAAGLTEKATFVQNTLRRLHDIKGEITDVFPNTAFLRIVVDGTLQNDLVYTIVRNKSYINTTYLMVDEDTRVKEEDSIDVVEGFVGSYPNFFFEIDYGDIGKFVEEYSQIDGYEKYNALVDKYGVRRTNPEFWRVSDWFYVKNMHDNPLSGGLFDLNRYHNR